MIFELQGTLKLVMPAQSFPSGFTKREFVVTTDQERYPQDIKMEVVKEKCSLLDAFQPGQRLSVQFDIRGQENNGRYFVNLAAWKISLAGEGGGGDEYAQEAPRRPAASGGGGYGGGGGAAPAARKQAAPTPPPVEEGHWDGDDVPF